MPINDPSDLSGLLYHYDAQALVGLNDLDKLQSFVDQGPSGFHLSESTDQATRPTYHSALFEGFPAISFDGANDFLHTVATGIMEGLAAFTVIFRGRIDDTGEDFGRVLDEAQSGVGNRVFLIQTGPDPNMEFIAQSDFTVSGGAVNEPDGDRSVGDAEPHTYIVRKDGTDLELWRDGVLIATTAVDGSTPSGKASPLAMGGQSSGSNNCRMDVQEAFTYTVARTDPELADIVDYLGRWEESEPEPSTITACPRPDTLWAACAAPPASQWTSCEQEAACAFGPVACYRLEEDDVGALIDSVGNFGAFSGDADSIQRGVAGILGSGVRCTGTDDQLLSLLPCGLADRCLNLWTLSLWALPEKVIDFTIADGRFTTLQKPQAYAIFPSQGAAKRDSCGFTGEPGWGSSDTSVAGVGVSVGTNGVRVWHSSTGIWLSSLEWQGAIGDWVHIAVTYDHENVAGLGVGLSLFVDGIRRGGPTPPSGFGGNAPSTFPGVELAWEGDTGRPDDYVGKLDEIHYYDRILSDAEVAQLEELERTGSVGSTVWEACA